VGASQAGEAVRQERRAAGPRRRGRGALGGRSGGPCGSAGPLSGRVAGAALALFPRDASGLRPRPALRGGGDGGGVDGGSRQNRTSWRNCWSKCGRRARRHHRRQRGKRRPATRRVARGRLGRSRGRAGGAARRWPPWRLTARRGRADDGRRLAPARRARAVRGRGRRRHGGRQLPRAAGSRRLGGVARGGGAAAPVSRRGRAPGCVTRRALGPRRLGVRAARLLRAFGWRCGRAVSRRGGHRRPARRWGLGRWRPSHRGGGARRGVRRGLRGGAGPGAGHVAGLRRRRWARAGPRAAAGALGAHRGGRARRAPGPRGERGAPARGLPRSAGRRAGHGRAHGLRRVLPRRRGVLPVGQGERGPARAGARQRCGFVGGVVLRYHRPRPRRAWAVLRTFPQPLALFPWVDSGAY